MAVKHDESAYLHGIILALVERKRNDLFRVQKVAFALRIRIVRVARVLVHNLRIKWEPILVRHRAKQKTAFTGTHTHA